MSNRIAPVLLLAFASASYGQDVPPGMTMHRLQAGSLDQFGWTTAASTEGAFSAKMPCTFNDFTFDDSSEGSRTRKTYTLGCLRPDRRKFSATRVQYRNADADAQVFFQKALSGEPWPGATIAKSTFNGLPTVDVAIDDATKCGFVRVLHAKPDNLVLVAEAPKPACAGLDTMSRRFFESLSVSPR